MADELQFSAWVRTKLLNQVTIQAGRLEGQLNIELKDQLSANSLQVDLAGFRFPSPAEIVAIKDEAIAKLVPSPGAHDAEESKLVHVDLHDCELPWRYTVKTQGQIYPWIVVIVGPSEKVKVAGDILDVDSTVLAVHRLSTSHRWAHVQIRNQEKISRLVAPIDLQPNTAYTAAIVCAFNSKGEWAWLDSGQRTPTEAPEPIRVFRSWSFTSGPAGDFESLVDRLRVRKTSQVGVVKLRYRDTDDQLQLRGAITRIDAAPAADGPVVENIKNDIRVLATKVQEPAPVDLPGDFPQRELIGLPEYGRPWNHDASLNEVPGTWLETINHDPRYRAIAGMGTWLGIEAQEELMQAAVEQAGALHSVADRIRNLALGTNLSARQWVRRFPEDAATRLEIVGSAMGRMVSDDGKSSVLARATNQTRPDGRASTLVPAIFSSAAARLLRCGTARARHLKTPGIVDRADLLTRAAAKPPAPVRAPGGLPHADRTFETDELLNQMPDSGIVDSDEFRELLSRWTGQPIKPQFLDEFQQLLDFESFKFSLACRFWLMLRNRRNASTRVNRQLLILVLRLTMAVKLSNDVCALLLRGAENVLSPRDAINVLELLGRTGYQGSIDCVRSKISDFFRPGINFIPVEEMFAILWGCANGDAIEVLIGCSLPQPPERFAPVPITELSNAVVAHVDPTAENAPAKIRVQDGIANYPIGTMASPELPLGLDFPAWQLVRDHAKDWLVPGVSTVPPDSIVTLKTNPPFIDAFMVGLNAQFMAEARWRNLTIEREFTSLRMFWGQVNPETGKRAADIKPIREWLKPPIGDLGSPQHQSIKPNEAGGNENLVILFRTELFRRYPATIVYLLKATEAEIDSLIQQQPEFGPPVPIPQRTFGPIFMGNVSEDVVFFTFHVPPSTLDQYWLVLDEPPAELRFRTLPFRDNLTFDPDSIDKHTRVAIQGSYLMKMGVAE